MAHARAPRLVPRRGAWHQRLISVICGLWQVTPPLLKKSELVGGPIHREVRTARAEVGIEAVTRRELLAESLIHYREAAELQESTRSTRATPYASVLATEGKSGLGASGQAVSLKTWMRDAASASRRAAVCVGLGAVRAALGQNQHAETHYRDGLRICPNHVDSLFGLACVTAGKHRLRYLKTLLRAKPTHTQAALMLAQCRRLVVVGADELGRPERANRFDTYVTVYWNGECLGNTKTKRQNVSPRWNDAFSLGVVARGQQANVLRLVVHNRVTKSLIGEVIYRVGGDADDDASAAAAAAANAALTDDDAVNASGNRGSVSGFTSPAAQQQEEKQDQAKAAEDDEEGSPPPPPGAVVIRRLCVVGASGLKSDSIGKADAFAVVVWNGVEVGRTAVERNTMAPEWYAEFDISVVPGRYNQLRVGACRA